MHKLIFFYFLLTTFGTTAYADVYKWVDKKGQIHFGDKPMDSQTGKSAKLLIATPSKKKAGSDQLGTHDLPSPRSSNEPARPALFGTTSKAAPGPGDIPSGPGSAGEPAAAAQ